MSQASFSVFGFIALTAVIARPGSFCIVMRASARSHSSLSNWSLCAGASTFAPPSFAWTANSLSSSPKRS